MEEGGEETLGPKRARMAELEAKIGAHLSLWSLLRKRGSCNLSRL